MATQLKNPAVHAAEGQAPGTTLPLERTPTLPVESAPTIPAEGDPGVVPVAPSLRHAPFPGEPLEVSRNPLGTATRGGEAPYRAYVGPPGRYDLISAMAFSLLAALGMRAHYRVLDIGCGSLRLGRLLIPFLDRGNYVGLDPDRWVVDEGLRHDLGRDILAIKDPQFHFNGDFRVPVESGPFHYAVATSLFSHAALAQIHRCLAMVQTRLTRAGVLLAAFMAGNEDYAGGEWVYPGTVTYKTATMANLAEQYSLRFQLLDWKHPNGLQWCLFARPAFDTSWFQNRPLSWNGTMDALGLS